MGFFYKLRSTRALLDEFHELVNQELFFASPDELNDPHEGFINLFWQGDTIVWKNLFRYYIFNLVLMVDSAHSKDALNLSGDLLHFNIHIKNKTHNNLAYKELESHILGSSLVNDIISYLSLNKVKLFQDELLYLFGCLHLHILKHICNTIDESVENKFCRIIQTAESDFNATNFINIYESGMLSKAAALNKGALLATHLKLLDGDTNLTLRKNYGFILKEYALTFIRKLRELTYNDVYISCFMKEAPSIDMWGYYGDSHKGCCLIFKTQKPEFLDSYVRSPDDDVIKITRTGGSEEIDMKIEPVIYNDDYPEVNFFDSVGAISRNIYKECWLSDGHQQSYYISHRYSNHNEWSDIYYHNMHSLFFRKTCHWKKENELRAIITTFADDNSISQRKVRYRFDSLYGIVFGMKTSHTDKCKIVKIIRDKCKENNVDDFKIFQSFYNHHENKMDKVELEDILCK